MSDVALGDCRFNKIFVCANFRGLSNQSSVIMTIRNNFEDSNRLYGGNRNNGGLANVNYNWHDNRNRNIAGRPLVVSF